MQVPAMSYVGRVAARVRELSRCQRTAWDNGEGTGPAGIKLPWSGPGKVI